MKTAVFYYSHHHENTIKVLRAMADGNDVELIDAANAEGTDFDKYDAVGLASGIYFSKFHDSVIALAGKLPEGKNVFFVYTCGNKRNGYTKDVSDAAAARGCKILGEFGCRGFDTYGPFKLIGGIAKNHPDSNDLDSAKAFYRSLSENANA